MDTGAGRATVCGVSELPRTLDRVWLELGLQLWPGWKLTKGWETIKENVSSLPPPLATHQLGGVITRGVKLPGAIPDWAGAIVCFPQRPPFLSA